MDLPLISIILAVFVEYPDLLSTDADLSMLCQDLRLLHRHHRLLRQTLLAASSYHRFEQLLGQHLDQFLYTSTLTLQPSSFFHLLNSSSHQALQMSISTISQTITYHQYHLLYLLNSPVDIYLVSLLLSLQAFGIHLRHHLPHHHRHHLSSTVRHFHY